MKDPIQTKDENPEGLHLKYKVRKFSHWRRDGTRFFGDKIAVFMEYPDEEYFILRLDDNQKDKKHKEACRKAVLFYADQIKDHLPKLSEDLIKRYSL